MVRCSECSRGDGDSCGNDCTATAAFAAQTSGKWLCDIYLLARQRLAALGIVLAGPVGWRGMLWVVAGLCLAMLVGVVVVLRETHPPELRTRGGAASLAAFRTVLASRSYRAPVAVFACRNK